MLVRRASLGHSNDQMRFRVKASGQREHTPHQEKRKRASGRSRGQPLPCGGRQVRLCSRPCFCSPCLTPASLTVLPDSSPLRGPGVTGRGGGGGEAAERLRTAGTWRRAFADERQVLRDAGLLLLSPPARELRLGFHGARLALLPSLALGRARSPLPWGCVQRPAHP